MARGRNRLRDYYTEHIDNDILGDTEINSREELIKLGDKENVKIDWNKWDELVKKTQDDIRNFNLSELRKKHNRKAKRIFFYKTKPFKLIKVYETAQELGEHLGVTAACILYNARKGEVWRDKYFFSFNQLEELPHVVVEKKVKQVCAYDLKSGKLIKTFKTQREASNYFGMNITQVGYIISRCNGIYQKKNLIFKMEEYIHNGRT